MTTHCLQLRRIHLLRTLALFTIAMLAVGVRTPAAQADAAPSSSFCQKSIVHNFAAPLERLPALRTPPTGIGLPFGSGNILVTRIGQRSLMFESEEVGFRLYLRQGQDIVSPPRLNWLVTTRLARVDRHGRVIQRLGMASKRVTGLGPRGVRPFSLPFSFAPGLYRLEIIFENSTGERLGRFGEYIRAMYETPIDARLTLNGTSFLPGQTVSAQAENHGTGVLSFGLGYSIEVFDGAAWVHSPIDPDGAIPLILLGVGPGEAGSCWGFSIPPDAPPGLYRFVVDADHTDGPQPNGPRTPLTLSSEFGITPPG